MNLELSLKQTLKLTPQMLQSMEVLQMSTQELADYIQDLVQMNPAAELTEPAAQSDESEEMWRRLQSLADADHQNRQYLSPDREELEDLSQASRLPLSALEQGLHLIQSLDPAGVGARDLSQCLALQLQRRGETGPALEIVLHHLERLGRKQYHAIAQEMGISQKEVLRAQSLIQELDPRPGAAFASRDETSYLVPDLVVIQDEQGLTVAYQDSYLPGLHLSGYYCKLQKQSADPEVKQYLTDKIKQARWSIQAVEQRRSTLLYCAQFIVRRQESFFRPGGHLSPLRLADVAQELSIHESTVSRAIREKYLQCSRGVYPLSFFFSREGGTEGTSVHQIKERLRQLVDQENKKHPLSDQKLCEQLEAEGCAISRRTVAKYRDELGIPSASGRKEIH